MAYIKQEIKIELEVVPTSANSEFWEDKSSAAVKHKWNEVKWSRSVMSDHLWPCEL